MVRASQVECRTYGAQIILGIEPQPFRAGLTFSGRPSGPRIHGDFAVPFLSQLAVGKLAAPKDKPETGASTVAYPTQAQRQGLTPISCHALLERSACAPFIKERRMECINATSLRRKSGQMGHPNLRCRCRKPGHCSPNSRRESASRLLGMRNSREVSHLSVDGQSEATTVPTLPQCPLRPSINY
jgi:hypothetical protein